MKNSIFFALLFLVGLNANSQINEDWKRVQKRGIREISCGDGFNLKFDRNGHLREIIDDSTHKHWDKHVFDSIGNWTSYEEFKVAYGETKLKKSLYMKYNSDGEMIFCQEAFYSGNSHCNAKYECYEFQLIRGRDTSYVRDLEYRTGCSLEGEEIYTRFFENQERLIRRNDSVYDLEYIDIQGYLRDSMMIDTLSREMVRMYFTEDSIFSRIEYVDVVTYEVGRTYVRVGENKFRKLPNGEPFDADEKHYEVFGMNFTKAELNSGLPQWNCRGEWLTIPYRPLKYARSTRKRYKEYNKNHVIIKFY